LKLILGSASPRRIELLAKLNINPSEVISPNIDEEIKKNELPLHYCKRIAHEKLQHFQNKHKDSIILTADTIAYSGRTLIDKTEDKYIAFKNLSRLSGKRHRVSTSFCIRNLENRIFKKTVTTVVSFKVLSNKDIEDYLKTNDWQGVAGSYKIQGIAESFIKSINGSYSNVVGLPLFEVNNLFVSAGYKWLS
tara:strand:+ start:178 stop:753 length:576 start_codon:yes stop_codon:yes gene_type:complete